MKVYNAKYDSTTNKIVAYLLPEPKPGGKYFNPPFDSDTVPRPYEGTLDIVRFQSDKKEWQNSKIEISVDDDLREFIHKKYMYDVTKSIKFYDLTTIMDSIDVSKCDKCFHIQGGMLSPDCCHNYYTAKIK